MSGINSNIVPRLYPRRFAFYSTIFPKNSVKFAVLYLPNEYNLKAVSQPKHPVRTYFAPVEIIDFLLIPQILDIILYSSGLKIPFSPQHLSKPSASIYSRFSVEVRTYFTSS